MRTVSANLMQIYGELSRLRVISGEKSKRGAQIEKFDAENNGYIPFMDSAEAFENYSAVKGRVKK